jgi:hypothetical protein
MSGIDGVEEPTWRSCSSSERGRAAAVERRRNYQQGGARVQGRAAERDGTAGIGSTEVRRREGCGHREQSPVRV